MCGRMTQNFDLEELAETCLDTAPKLPPTLPVAVRQRSATGTTAVPVRISSSVASRQGETTFSLLRWGFVPSWPSGGSPARINARSETIHRNPRFRDAFRERRSVVPVRGWFEWHRKQPWFLHSREDRPILLAGLWEREAGR